MIAFLRLAVFGLLALTVVYLIVAAYFASLHRERLEREWQAAPRGTREEFLAEGMRAWRHGARHKLILGVYVVPVLVVAGLIYLINYS